MIQVELRFPVIGTTLPSDHGYAMFAAISRVIPEVHSVNSLAVETVPGVARGHGTTRIDRKAKFKIRLTQERIPLMLKLAGERLDVGGHSMRLGAPQIFLLKPASSLYARCVSLYHSRFRYKDRSLRHRQVIDNFKRDGVAAVLIATQVAEMSLDLSADLLITDIAPIPSLIQRMGRLNRRSTPDNPIPAKLALVRELPRGEPNAALPYDKADVERAVRWLRSLNVLNKPLSQRDLSEAFAEFGELKEYDLVEAEKRAVFFSGLWRTRPGLTRGEGYSMSVILELDLQNCKERNNRGEPTRDWLRRHEVSIPIKDVATRWERVGTYRIAPSDLVEYDYNEETKEGTGARWRKN